MDVANLHAPLMEKRVRGNPCPWLTGEIKRDIRQHNYLLRKAKQSLATEDWLAYKSHRNRVTKSIKNAKSKYNIKVIEDCGGNPKAFWKAIKNILPGETKTVSTNFNIDGEVVTDYKSIAESFKNFFLGTVGRLVKIMNDSVMSFTDCTAYNPSTVRTRGTASSFAFEEISEQFIYTQLRKLKTCKAVGLDQMPSHLMKDSASVISKPLAVIMNLSISQVRIPCDWKIARVLPLFKGGKKCDMDNYRPISILPVASKILGRTIHTQLCRFLTANNILSSSQCGFRKLLLL